MLIWRLIREFENFERDLSKSWTSPLDEETLFTYKEVEKFLKYLSLNFDISRKEKYEPKRDILSEELIKFFKDNDFQDRSDCYGYYQKRICSCYVSSHDSFLQIYVDGEYDVVDSHGRDVRVDDDNIPNKILTIEDVETVLSWYREETFNPINGLWLEGYD